ncbi:bifunctional nuclease family protein [Dysgonomonas sp. 25]|uniref:bifunctional nuclease family protein n=1 Tax=Dysgonomonas sp. 25 TaxID=2302933 RepID=UPI0013D79986|nr:bifunctional nuclease family protein [Dysgonomonas sp. 25]NDV68665.1 hypothetical protein [Dysgonomonas sp. 25]
MESRVRLSVLGFSFNQNKTGSYGLVLAEENGLRRLMVVVGTPEAQSIAFQLQKTPPPRPLTHDLMHNIFRQFNIEVVEIDIYRYDDGIFYSRILLRQGEALVDIESRTSDAVSIALRANAPIYTTESIMQTLGIVFDEKTVSQEKMENEEEQEVNGDLNLNVDYSLLKKDELQTMLDEAVKGEDYELASILRDELKKKDSDF